MYLCKKENFVNFAKFNKNMMAHRKHDVEKEEKNMWR